MQITIPEVFHELFEPKRFKCYYGGRGGAKSHAFARALLVKGMEKKMRIVCAREIQKNVKGSVHTLLADLVRSYELEGFYSIQEAVIKGKNGTEILFSGLKHNATGIKSLEGSDIWWVEEAENVSANSWEVLIPTVRKDNSEIWVSFNTKNISDPTYQNFVAKQDDDILCRKVSWRDNPYFPEVLNKERLRLMEDDYEAYLHVWEGEPDTRHSGAVYAKKLAKAREEGRITTVPYDPSFQVFTAWDLGFGDSTSIWWLQFVGRELRWIDFYENNGELLDHYAKVIKEKPYNYYDRGHFLPHDGAAANIRGEAVPDQLRKMGINCTILARATNLRAERDLLNNTIAFSAFDAHKCADGILALENYHFEWDVDRGVFKKEPLHDWSSHASDAARYAAIAASKIKGGLYSATPAEFKNKADGLQSVSRFKGINTKRLRSRR
jgi:phage terminase large subunit